VDLKGPTSKEREGRKDRRKGQGRSEKGGECTYLWGEGEGGKLLLGAEWNGRP